MFVDALKENSGLIFVFGDQGNYSFWMKNMLIPLDIIWINENQELVYVSKNNAPCNDGCISITPPKEAKYVLEINAGLADKYGFEAGDKVWLHLV
jgi:uncharacterized membrane protein (UPF0127 family)